MSLSNWLRNFKARRWALAALTVLALQMPGECLGEQNGQPEATQTQGDPAQPIKPPAAAETPTPRDVSIPVSPTVIDKQRAQTSEYQANCEKPADREDANFCQQRRAAKAAEDAVIVAREQYSLGIWGLIGLCVTILLTAWAAIAATKAANASAASAEHAAVSATAANDAAMVALQAERAWIGFSKLVPVTTGTFSDTLTMVNIYKLQWTNTGRTPAKNVRCDVRIAVLPVSQEPGEDFFVFDNINVASGTLPPGGDIYSGEFGIKFEYLTAVLEETKNVFIYCRSTYQTIFDKTIDDEHFTESSFVLVCNRKTLYLEAKLIFHSISPPLATASQRHSPTITIIKQINALISNTPRRPRCRALGAFAT